MEADVKQTAAVYGRSLAAHFRSIVEYPADFWVMAVSGSSWQVLQFAFLSVMFGHIDSIAGWGYHEMLVLAGFLSLTNAATELFWDGIWGIPDQVVEGGMDYRILRPAPVAVQLAAGHVGMQGFGAATLGLAMLVYGWIGAELSPMLIPLAFALFLCAAALEAAILTITNCANFWIKGRMPVVAFMTMSIQDETLRYPLTVLPAAVRLTLTFVLPIAFANFIPAAILTGRLDGWWLITPPLAAVITVALAALTMRSGLRAYDSAGH